MIDWNIEICSYSKYKKNIINVCSTLTICIFINFEKNKHKFIYCDKIILMNEFYIDAWIFSYKQLDRTFKNKKYKYQKNDIFITIKYRMNYIKII